MGDGQARGKPGATHTHASVQAPGCQLIIESTFVPDALLTRHAYSYTAIDGRREWPRPVDADALLPPFSRSGNDSPISRHFRWEVFRLPVLMDLYIHPLYVLVSKILSSIFNSPARIHPLYHPLSTLSNVGPTYHFI
jgi:hypothetical protein